MLGGTTSQDMSALQLFAAQVAESPGESTAHAAGDDEGIAVLYAGEPVAAHLSRQEYR